MSKVFWTFQSITNRGDHLSITNEDHLSITTKGYHLRVATHKALGADGLLPPGTRLYTNIITSIRRLPDYEKFSMGGCTGISESYGFKLFGDYARPTIKEEP